MYKEELQNYLIRRDKSEVFCCESCKEFFDSGNGGEIDKLAFCDICLTNGRSEEYFLFACVD